MRIRGKHYATGELVQIVFQDGKIHKIGTPTEEPADVEGEWLAPALFDLQINGCDGHSFNSDRLTVESVRHVVHVCRRHGIGGLCPTLVTNSFAAIAHGLTSIRRACETDPRRDLTFPRKTDPGARIRSSMFAGRIGMSFSAGKKLPAVESDSSPWPRSLRVPSNLLKGW